MTNVGFVGGDGAGQKQPPVVRAVSLRQRSCAAFSDREASLGTKANE